MGSVPVGRVTVSPLKITSMELMCSLSKKTEHLQDPSIMEPKKSNFVPEQEKWVLFQLSKGKFTSAYWWVGM